MFNTMFKSNLLQSKVSASYSNCLGVGVIASGVPFESSVMNERMKYSLAKQIKKRKIVVQYE